MSLTFQKATRKRVKLKVLIDGPSGSGKTIGALHLARGIVGQAGRVAVIDSERDRSEYYADKYDFDKLSLQSLRPQDYIDGIEAAIKAGYDFVIVDSLSHAWLNVLERKEAYDKANKNTNQWTNWRTFTEEWDKLIRHILAAPIHIIATARSKQAHEQVEDGGKKKVIKLGLAPQLREGTEYEFAVVFSLNESHFGEATKDNTFLFGDKTEPINLLSEKTADRLRNWLSTATDEPKPDTNGVPTQTVNNSPQGTMTLDKMISVVESAKFPDALSVSQWIARVSEKLPEVADIPDELTTLPTAVRESVDMGEQQEFTDLLPEQVVKAKAAILNWMRACKPKKGN
mgnify:CR=1 FL=1